MKRIILFFAMTLLPFSFAQAQDMPGLPAGIQAPDFEAKTSEGRTIKLSEYYAQGPVVLIFYRGGWCPYCNAHLQAFQSRLDDFKEYGASIIAVSVDKQEKAAKTVQEKGLDFTVVTDPQADLLKSYNVIYKVPDELAAMYKEKYNIDLEGFSGRIDHVIAVPATYVIDQSGKIIFSYANEDYKVRTKPEEVLAVLAEI